MIIICNSLVCSFYCRKSLQRIGSNLSNELAQISPDIFTNELIYDIVLLLKGEIASAIYPIIYFIICFIYLICSIIDFFFIESIVKLICEPPRIIYLEDKADEKKNEEVDNEDNKTKLE